MNATVDTGRRNGPPAMSEQATSAEIREAVEERGGTQHLAQVVRLNGGMTAADIARWAEVSVATAHRWLRGTNEASGDGAVRLCALFDDTLDRRVFAAIPHPAYDLRDAAAWPSA